MIRTRTPLAAVAAIAALAAAPAMATVLVENSSNNGYFAPFNAANASTVKYGDSWWIGDTGTAYFLNSITLHLATTGTLDAGSTDLTLTINDGDPSGLVFGSGIALYTTTISNLTLPGVAGDPGLANYFSLTVPLPNVQTLGGFNNVGISVSLANFSFDGSFGFQASTAGGQTTGFYTNNASFFNGSSWSLFAFSGDPNFGIANYTVTIEGVPVPAPATGLLFAGAGLLTARRRR